MTVLKLLGTKEIFWSCITIKNEVLSGEIMNEMDYGLTYGCVAEFLNDTSLWFEPITDEIDGMVLRDGNASIIEMWLPIRSSSPLVDED